VRLRFATDVILCAATFIGEIIAFVESLLKKERAGPLEFPQKSAILQDYTSIINPKP